MQLENGELKINTESSLKAFFHAEICKATEQHRLEVCEDTIWYLSNLLHNFSRSDKFFDYHPDGGTLTPLFDYYQQAIEASNEHERRLYLQKLGDVAIFITGLFAPALNRRAVGVSYYMAMGENAYGFLADTAGASSRDRALADIFSDLSSRFSGFVSVISEVGNPFEPKDDRENLLHLIDEWERTSDPALATRLKLAGVMLPTEPELAH